MVIKDLRIIKQLWQSSLVSENLGHCLLQFPQKRARESKKYTTSGINPFFCVKISLQTKSRSYITIRKNSGEKKFLISKTQTKEILIQGFQKQKRKLICLKLQSKTF